MKERELIARINRIERHLGLVDIPGFNATTVKAYRDRTGLGYELCKDMLAKELIAELFKVERND